MMTMSSRLSIREKKMSGKSYGLYENSEEYHCWHLFVGFHWMQAFSYLKQRGLIYQSSQMIEEALKAITSSQSIYLGIDPTAKGLHIGHLMACRILKRFHDCGVHSIALVHSAVHTSDSRLVERRHSSAIPVSK